MAEDKKDNKTSQEKSSEAEKKPAQPAPAPAPVPAPQAPPTPPRAVPPAQAASAAPRPASVPPRPPVPPPASPARLPKSSGRRTFIKALAAVGAVLSVVPFVPWGNFLLSSVSSSGAYKRQKALLYLNTPTNKNANGAVAGKAVNVNDLASFPPNGSWLLTYPSSGDLTIDSQNPDTFQKFALIRLPRGTSKTAADFVAFSKVCVHLWCSPNYDPQKSSSSQFETNQCPCHGSIYEVPDGKAIAGPASVQAFPTYAIPMLTLTANANGDLYIEPPVFDVEHNGVIGYGRDFASYQNYILPVAEGKKTP